MSHDPADIPVILLYNLDRSWPPTDVDEILAGARPGNGSVDSGPSHADHLPG